MAQLNSTEKLLVWSALDSLGVRQPSFKDVCSFLQLKVSTDQLLMEEEQRFIALALQGKAMYDGPDSWHSIVPVAEKMGILPFLMEYLRQFIGYATEKTASEKGD